MKCAYTISDLFRLAAIKESKRWLKSGLIRENQFQNISNEYSTDLYHPNFLIRILLFAATILALSGITGFLGLIVADITEDAIFTACFFYGLVSFFAVESIFIRSYKHFKSGVNEAIIYHACLFTIIGASGIADFQEDLTFLITLLVLTFAAIRYVDITTTVCTFIALVAFLFYEFFQLGGIYSQIIPFLFIVLFSIFYFLVKKLRHNPSLDVWENNLLMTEALCLIVVYASGNYFVVRELSIDFMGMVIEPGEDMPFAVFFYLLTIFIPITYLVVGLRRKDIVLLRVSLLAIAFSVFTFKYYFSLGHPEITLTVAGAVLLAITLLLMNYLKIVRHGYTRENLLEEKWGNENLSAFVVSQTLANSHTVPETNMNGGGEFGGGGATGSY